MNKRLLVLVLVVCIALVGALQLDAGVVPGHSKAFGKSLGEWMGLYWTWFLGGDQEGNVKKVVFLPLPGEDDDFVLDVTLRTGEKFILPMFVFVGETYLPELELPDDDPAGIPDEIFTGADVLIMLDGVPIIDSQVDDISEFFFDPEYFDSVIDYEGPTDYGAIGAIWVKGIGFAHTPLPKGEHTLTLEVSSYYEPWDLYIEFNNAWNITVE